MYESLNFSSSIDIRCRLVRDVIHWKDTGNFIISLTLEATTTGVSRGGSPKKVKKVIHTTVPMEIKTWRDIHFLS